MTGQPPPSQQRDRQRSREQQGREREERTDPRGESSAKRTGDQGAQDSKAKGKSPGIKTEPAKVTLGKAGEQNLRIEWVDVPLGGDRSVYFNIVTAAGNALEVEAEQASYRKAYRGSGSLRTDVMPVAPIGTRGRLVVRDTSTGEVLEQPWVWISLSGMSLFGLIVAAFKKLFTNG
jgi:hypothetical protein